MMKPSVQPPTIDICQRCGKKLPKETGVTPCPNGYLCRKCFFDKPQPPTTDEKLDDFPYGDAAKCKQAILDYTAQLRKENLDLRQIIDTYARQGDDLDKAQQQLAEAKKTIRQFNKETDW